MYKADRSSYKFLHGEMFFEEQGQTYVHNTKPTKHTNFFANLLSIMHGMKNIKFKHMCYENLHVKSTENLYWGPLGSSTTHFQRWVCTSETYCLHLQGERRRQKVPQKIGNPISVA